MDENLEVGDIGGDFGQQELRQETEQPAGPMPDLAIVFMAIGVSLLMSVTTEAIGWLVVYRHDDYKKSVQEVTNLQERVEALEEKMQYSIGTLAVNQ